MYCSNCGRQIEDDIRFCPGCGAEMKPLVANQPPTVVAASAMKTDDFAPIADEQIQAYEERRGRWNRRHPTIRCGDMRIKREKGARCMWDF